MTHSPHSRATAGTSTAEPVPGWGGRVGVHPIDSPPPRGSGAAGEEVGVIFDVVNPGQR